jgi:hypothetical protein
MLKFEIKIDDIGELIADVTMVDEVSTGTTTAEDCGALALVGAIVLVLAADEAVLEAGKEDEVGALPAWSDPLGRGGMVEFELESILILIHFTL